MGKMKAWLLEDMENNPENYNNPELTEEEYDAIQKLKNTDALDVDKDEIESIIIDNKKDTL